MTVTELLDQADNILVDDVADMLAHLDISSL